MRIIKIFFGFSAGAALLIAFMVFYAFKIEPYLLTVQSYDIINENSSEEVTVIHLSDIELSENYKEDQLEKIVQKVNLLNADIIVFTGDLFSNYKLYSPVPRVVELLSQLEAKSRKIAIWGNNDYGGGAYRVYSDIMSESGFELLENSGVNIQLDGGKNIFIGGLDDSLLGNPDINETMSYRNDDSVYTILLSHEPDIAKDITDNSINLILSGHTHGGQVSFKYFLEKYNIVGEYIAGRYELEHLSNTTLFVSNGFGTSRFPIRFLAPPQILYFKIMV